mgnify:CR=1 FL=1
MLTMEELLKGTELTTLDKVKQDNLFELLAKINQIRTAWGKPMTVTSGFRSMQDHLRIYKEKGITDTKKIPMASNHLSGRAVDISDPDGSLMAWCQMNESLLVGFGLWCEEPDSQKRVHFQTVAPKSGRRFFTP